MKNAMIFHGNGETPNSFWHPSIKSFLEKHGYEVWAPQLPDADNPNLRFQLPFVLKNGKFNAETIIIAHSARCPLCLAVLENISVKISKAILVAGFCKCPKNLDLHPILQRKYGWEKIRKNVKEIIFINSDNDPWGADDKQGYYMFRNLGGTLIIRHGEGHMGSNRYKQPYKKFPLLEKLLF